MTKELNKDGLIPGQPVSFEEMQRINNARKKAPDTSSDNQDEGTREQLVERAAELGITHHPNIGVPKLRAKVEEAEAKAKEDSEQGSVQ